MNQNYKKSVNNPESFLQEMDSVSIPEYKLCDEVRIDPITMKIIAYGFSCQRKNCNCIGGWWEGDSESFGIILKKQYLQDIVSEIIP